MVRKCFLDDEAGAVTVDWVVLTAALIGICFLVLVPFSYGIDNAVTTITTFIATGVPPG